MYLREHYVSSWLTALEVGHVALHLSLIIIALYEYI